MFAKITDALRGARKAELFVILALISVLLLGIMKSSGTSANLESRLASVLEKISGAGKVEVMINQDSQGNTLGILIIAEGAGDISVKLEILRSVKTLMGVDANQIEITRMGGG